MGSEITLISVYDKVAGIDSKIDAHIARVDVQLLHGQKKMDDLERQVGLLRDAVPDRLEERLTELERVRWRAAGAVAALAALSSGGLATIVTYALTHH